MADAVQVFPPGFRVVDATGTPYSGAVIYFYEAGTDTPNEVYSDADLSVSLGTSVYTDSAGYPVAASGSSAKVLVYTGTDAYKVTIKTSAGVEIVSHDEVKGAAVGGGGGGGVSGITQAAADARYTRNANALSAVTTIADSDIIPFWSVAGAANVGITYNYLKDKLEADGAILPEGTVATFYQAAAPTGWTRITTAGLNGSAIRIVTSSTAGTTGGTAEFTAVFTSRTITQANLPSVTLSGTTNTTGNHTHTIGHSGVGTGLGTGGSSVTRPISSDNTGTDGSHSHTVSVSLGGSGTAMDFAVKYFNMMIATKDAI